MGVTKFADLSFALSPRGSSLGCSGCGSNLGTQKATLLSTALKEVSNFVHFCVTYSANG